MNATSTKKVTIATVKAFIRRNYSCLLVRVSSSFDGMSDCVMDCDGAEFLPAVHKAAPSPNDMGVRGVWFTRSRNWCEAHDDGRHVGFKVSNCCGSWVVAIAKTPAATDDPDAIVLEACPASERFLSIND